MKVSCIIPFYNEGGRILKILEIVTKVRGITEIICVDDGSSDDAYKDVERFKGVRLIKHPKNLGKAEAVLTGVKSAAGEYILLVDADINRLRITDLEIIIDLTYKKDLDLMILRMKEGQPFRILGSDLLLSGERILKRADLLKIFEKTNPQGFELESTINKYMLDNKKKIGWIQGSGGNFNKIYKFGLINGAIRDIKMFFTVINYLGLDGYLKQRSIFLSNHLD